MEFNAENGSFAIIDVELKAADNVVVVRDTALLPSEVPFKMKIKKLNSNNRIIQQEIVEITEIVGKNLTITRAAEKIPYGENSTTFTQSALDFDGDDIMELVFTAQDGRNFANEITSLENRKIERVNTIGIFEDYTFTGNEINNTQFNVDTTTADTTLTIDLSLFPTTNGLYQFTVVKDSGDANKVILDLGTATIDGNSIYQLVGDNESVTFVIESNTKAKVVSTSNAPSAVDIAGQTEVTSLNNDDEFILNRPGEGNKKAEIKDVGVNIGSNIENAGGNINKGLMVHKNKAILNNQTLDGDNFISSSYYIKFGDSDQRTRVCQSFTVGSSDVFLNTVKVYAGKENNPTDGIRAVIYTGIFTGIIGYSDNIIDATEINDSINNYTTVIFNFNNFKLNPNTIYYIGFERTGTLTTSNMYSLSRRNSRENYGEEAYIYRQNYSDYLIEDDINMFVEYQTISGYDSKVYQASITEYGLFLEPNYGINQKTILSGSDTEILVEGVDYNQTGLTKGSKVYLQENGTLSNTPTLYPVGVAVGIDKVRIKQDILYKQTSNSATTGSVVTGNAEGYIVININGEPKKIPYYGV